MAILTGFPPSNTISPGVRIAEKDLSYVAPEQSFHRAGLVGFASKGPINVPTLITSSRQLHTVFGYPHPESGDPYLLYAADAYLLVATELYVVRVGQTEAVNFEQATTAVADVPSAGGQIKIVTNTDGPYIFSTDSFFRYRLNGVLSPNTLVVLQNLAGITATDLAAQLNAQLDPVQDGIQFYVSNTTKIAVQTTFAYGPASELELVSVQDAMYPVMGIGTTMTAAVAPGTADATGVDYAGIKAAVTNLTLNLVVDGTDNVAIDNQVQVLDFTGITLPIAQTNDLATYLNNLKIENGGSLVGGWQASAVGNTLVISTLHKGRDARIRVKVADSTAAAALGFTDMTYSGTSPVGSNPGASYTFGRVNGTAAVQGDTTFTFTADSPGTDGNATQVVVRNNLREGTFDLSVYNNGVQVEAWGGLTKDQSSTYYVESYLAVASDWVRVLDDINNAAPPLDGTYTLAGGSDGIPADPDVQDQLLMGNEVGYSGLYALSEPEQIDIDLVAIPGHSSTTIVLALIDFCQNKRQDCLAIIDPPFGLTVNEVVAWQNGAHPLNNTRFDSDFAALYWPWVKIRDNFNQLDIWAPPSGSVMAMIANSDKLGAPWLAPAGQTRGIIPGITDVFSRPTQTERDLGYGYRNCVNAIVQFPDVQGFVAWGQKTLQRRPTALDRINVRRMLFVAEKRIRQQSRALLFEPHDAQLRAQFVRMASSVLDAIKIGRGINDYIVQCDESLNPPDVIDRNELRARIGIQPTKAAEFIFIEFSIHRTGSWTANADTIPTTSAGSF